MIGLDALQKMYDNRMNHTGSITWREEITAQFPALVAHIKSIEAQLGEARKDAERYRWLNLRGSIFIRIDAKNMLLKCGETLDAWIDAEIDKAPDVKNEL